MKIDLDIGKVWMVSGAAHCVDLTSINEIIKSLVILLSVVYTILKMYKEFKK